MAINFDTLFADASQLDAFKKRFGAKLRRDGHCVVWTAAKTSKGYGVIGFGPRSDHVSIYAHRVALWMATGEQGADKVVMHSCDNRACCNPAHLSLGTYMDNTQDMLAKGRESRGAKHPSAKLNEEQVKAIRDDLRSLPQIADDYPVGITQVSRVKRRVDWAHVA